jgi:Tfp pilus assembly protein PilE
MSNSSQEKGFGLIQLLIVVTACALLCSFVILFTGNYRAETRDLRRLSDIDQIRNGLELYYNQASGYPDISGWTTGRTITCQGTKLFTIPKDPNSGFIYNYKTAGKSMKGCGDTQTVWSSYAVQFNTETKSVLGPADAYCMRPYHGTTEGVCP